MPNFVLNYTKYSFPIIFLSNLNKNNKNFEFSANFVEIFEQIYGKISKFLQKVKIF